MELLQANNMFVEDSSNCRSCILTKYFSSEIFAFSRFLAEHSTVPYIQLGKGKGTVKNYTDTRYGLSLVFSESHMRQERMKIRNNQGQGRSFDKTLTSGRISKTGNHVWKFHNVCDLNKSLLANIRLDILVLLFQGLSGRFCRGDILPFHEHHQGRLRQAFKIKIFCFTKFPYSQKSKCQLATLQTIKYNYPSLTTLHYLNPHQTGVSEYLIQRKSAI